MIGSREDEIKTSWSYLQKDCNKFGRRGQQDLLV